MSFEIFRNWRYGLHRLQRREINRLNFPDGILLKVEPSKCSMDSLVGMQRVLYMLQQYPGRFSFEIWKDQGLDFYFFSSKNSTEGMLVSQLNSVYPQIKIERSDRSLPEVKEGDYVSSCTLGLYGPELNLACAESFHYEPYNHILEALNSHQSKAIVQILFEGLKKIPKDKRVIVSQKYGESSRAPLFRCLVRIAAISKDGYESWESCEHIARTFSVFDSRSSYLILKMLSFSIPYFKDSYRSLKSMVKRNFPLLSRDFMASTPELASMVHLPVKAEDHGVDYSKPSLAPPPFFRGD